MQAQHHIPTGYKWFNGVVLNPTHTDVYNTLTDEIERWRLDYPTHPKIETLLTERHRWVNYIFSVYQ